MSESFIKETIRCHFAHNYEQVTLLEVNDLLLNVFSQCVKIHIDEQNAIITDIYLQEYSKNPNDDPLCEAKHGAPQKEMDDAIDKINKENSEVIGTVNEDKSVEIELDVNVKKTTESDGQINLF